MLNTLRDLPVFEPRDLIKSIMLATLEGICMGLPYGLFVQLVRELVNRQPNYTLIIAVSCAIALVMLIRVWVTRQNTMHTGTMTYKTCATLRERLAHHFFKVPLGFFERHNSGQLSQSMNKDVEFTETIFSHHFSQFIASVSLLLTVSGCLAIYDWRLALCLLSGLPIALTIQAVMKRKANQFSESFLQGVATTNNAIMDWILGIRAIKQSGQGNNLFPKLEQQIQHTQKASIRHEIAVGIVPMLFILFSEMGFLVLLLIGLQLYLTQQVELTVFIVFLITSVRLYRALAQIALTMAEARFMQQAAKRITTLLATPTMRTKEQNLPIQGHIAVNDVTFRYSPESPKVLDAISFTAVPGTLTALVGPSGSGKSTLLHLLARFWQVDDHKITFDGHSINAFSDASLYQQVALVSQDIHLIDDTILNNLKMVHQGLSEASIHNACQQAQCHDFIMQLPNGYDTLVGEAGDALSGGEKQRIALARALLSEAKIILLDEISAALDVRNEAALLTLLEQLKQSKTLISISHRESMVIHADNVVYLVNGLLKGTGHHEMLLQESKNYQDFWHHPDKSS